MTFPRILISAAVIIGVAIAIGLPLREWRRARTGEELTINAPRRKATEEGEPGTIQRT